MLRIYESVCNAILSGCPSVPPESGGFLGSKAGIICAFEFDNGLFTDNQGTYRPNYELLLRTASLWDRKNIKFRGIFHTHLRTQETLSSDDKEFIKAIMKENRNNFKTMYFPLVIPREKIIMFMALNSPLGFIIKKINYTIIKEV